MTKAMHWTEQDTKKFQFAIALDFIDQLEARMAELKWSRTKLAKKAKVDKSYVSQVLNNPGNLSIETVVKFARALKLKVSVVAYDDGDESNERGPINADIFRLCWEHAKKPADMWSFKETTQTKPATEVHVVYVPTGHHGWHQSSEFVGGAEPRRGYKNPRLKPNRIKPEGKTSPEQLIKELTLGW